MTKTRRKLIRSRKQFTAIGRVLLQLHLRSAPTRKRKLKA